MHLTKTNLPARETMVVYRYDVQKESECLLSEWHDPFRVECAAAAISIGLKLQKKTRYKRDREDTSL